MEPYFDTGTHYHGHKEVQHYTVTEVVTVTLSTNLQSPVWVGMGSTSAWRNYGQCRPVLGGLILIISLSCSLTLPQEEVAVLLGLTSPPPPPPDISSARPHVLQV